MSSVIKSIDYSRANETLSIVFHYSPKIVYVYSNVKYQKNTYFQNAESLGKYFNEKIKKNAEMFPFEKFDIV